MPEQVLAVQDVVKVFDEGTQKVEVLRGVTMEVARGEVVALEGPSGSGKTTLLSIMGCILTPTSGRVDVAGGPGGGARPDPPPAGRGAPIPVGLPPDNRCPALAPPGTRRHRATARRRGGAA